MCLMYQRYLIFIVKVHQKEESLFDINILIGYDHHNSTARKFY